LYAWTSLSRWACNHIRAVASQAGAVAAEALFSMHTGLLSSYSQHCLLHVSFMTNQESKVLFKAPSLAISARTKRLQGKQ